MIGKKDRTTVKYKAFSPIASMAHGATTLVTGLERVEADASLLKGLGRVGLVCNQAVVTQAFRPCAEVIWEACRQADGTELTCIFGPQHGYTMTEQDNMLETPDTVFRFRDGHTVPLFSLYSQNRAPTTDQLSHVDTLLIDLMDVGCRVYTYMLTLAGCLRVASTHAKKVRVLDRPNPLGLSFYSSHTKRWTRVEGNCLDTSLWQSFVGEYPLAFRHGLTLGELGCLFVKMDDRSVDYDVFTVEGLTRATPPSLLSRRLWTTPSPNLPTWDCAFFFPAFVTLEGTNMSEGRGTTLPFKTLGAPYLDPVQFIRELETLQGSERGNKPYNSVQGITAREHSFRPTFDKHKGAICHGLQFYCSDYELPNLFALGMRLLHFCAREYPDTFAWKGPGYEYNFQDLPILLILGNDRWFRLLGFTNDGKRVENHHDSENALEEALQWADDEAQAFAERCKSIHLYV